ncbi:leucyl aminopeptidase family protein [Jiulongibacter sp. NS-SX5]|uniref:leucyl aminopeptidase family protein n=1 Tax=Jiulongibacter sp. NS-SX5 TaxID=3463854 RepID=UPI004057E34D
MLFQLTSQKPQSGHIILPYFQSEDLIDKICENSLLHDQRETLKAISFSAKKGEQFTFLTQNLGYPQVTLLGLGKVTADETQMINLFRSVFSKNKSDWRGEIIIDLRGSSEQLAHAVNGIELASYELGMLKTKKAEKPDLFSDESSSITFWVEAVNDQLQNALEVGLKTGETQKNIMALVDSPSNYKTPEIMAEYIQKSGAANGFEVTVYDEKQCEELGFLALLSVGRGSVDRPAKMVVMEYKGGNRKVGFVGKGVTFDTGGVSLKPGSGMEDMKMDMGGSAAVIGAVELTAKLKLDVHLIGIVALTENCIDALAIKPGDVINSYSGKTIEVINTDAEGRLILADAINYMVKTYDPELMIDLATLTGSCIRTLGHVSAGMMTNNEDLADLLNTAGLKTGEKVWRLPLTDDYRDELNSDVADIKNLGGPYAGATTAGKFLEFFTEEHKNWAHLDIAGTAFKKSEFSKGGSATAYGVRLLSEVLKQF